MYTCPQILASLTVGTVLSRNHSSKQIVPVCGHTSNFHSKLNTLHAKISLSEKDNPLKESSNYRLKSPCYHREPDMAHRLKKKKKKCLWTFRPYWNILLKSAAVHLLLQAHTSLDRFSPPVIRTESIGQLGSWWPGLSEGPGRLLCLGLQNVLQRVHPSPPWA